MKTIFNRIRKWLSGLSFRTGVIVLLSCVVFYAISFGQLLIPMSPVWHTALWVIFFGLAKTAQYGGLAILGVEGYKRLKKYFSRKKSDATGQDGHREQNGSQDKSQTTGKQTCEEKKQ